MGLNNRRSDIHEEDTTRFTKHTNTESISIPGGEIDGMRTEDRKTKIEDKVFQELHIR